MASKSSDDVLRSLIDTLKLCVEQMRDGSMGMESFETSFSLKDFWNKFGMTLRAVSKEATRMTIVFSKPPLPTSMELQSLLTEFETAIIAMLTVFHSLPAVSQGKTLHSKVKALVILILVDAQSLAESYLVEGCSRSKEKLQTTGTIWQHCDEITSLPYDNRDAVLKEMKTTGELVKDALTELEQIQSNNGCQDVDNSGSDDSNTSEQCWSVTDQMMAPPVMGLAKACRSCLKKVSGAVRTNSQLTSEETVNQLDNVVTICCAISPCIDELVSSLYAPMNRDKVIENAGKVAEKLKELLSFSRSSHFTGDSECSWLDFLGKAVDHNLAKLKTVVKE